MITRGRLDEVVPIQNAAMAERTVIEWDKDDLDALGILKIDILALGMLTALRKGFELMTRHYGHTSGLAAIPAEDPAVYRMISRADTVGVFQIESRAQMSMLPRLKPRTFYDLVIEVAIVRPGPIQGDMVHPYLRRRQGLEPVTYHKPELEAVLGKTLGVPLFQEQAMRIAIVAGGFTPAQADRLRRAMATFRRVGTIHSFQTRMVEGMVAKGYPRDFAERCFRQIEGFGEYGFPESHAASFALLVYASAWMKCHYPDVFACALLNSQPMGFYAPAQILRDAREHGVEVRPVDINASDRASTLEPGRAAGPAVASRHADQAEAIRSTRAIRLGFDRIKGLSSEAAERIVARRGRGYDSVADLADRTGLDRGSLERLADADVFAGLGLSRRDAIWAVAALGPDGEAGRLPLFACAEVDLFAAEPRVALPPMPPGEEVIEDYRTLSLSLKGHPVAFLRGDLARIRGEPAATLADRRAGAHVRVAGLMVSPLDAVIVSLVSAVLATVFAVAVGVPAARVAARRAGGVADRILLLPLGVSATTIGLGLLLAFGRPPLDLRRAWWLVPAAQALVAVPLVVRAVASALGELPPSVTEVAATLGASPRRRWWRVELPMVRGAVVAGAGLAFVASLGEFGATVFLARADRPTVPVAIERLMSRPGSSGFGQAMALSCILVLLCGVVLMIVDMAADRIGRGRGTVESDAADGIRLGL